MTLDVCHLAKAPLTLNGGISCITPLLLQISTPIFMYMLVEMVHFSMTSPLIPLEDKPPEIA